MNPVLALALVAAAGIGATRLPLPSLDRPLPRALVRAGVPLLLLGFLLGSGIGMIDPRMLRAVAPVTALAVGWLGARFGARWEWRLVRRVPRTDWGLAGIQAVATLALVAAAALALERVRPALAGAWAPALPAALALGAFAVVSGPRAVARAARTAGIRGRSARTLERAAILDTALGVVAFTAILARAHPRTSPAGAAPGPITWLLLVGGTGALVGLLFLSLTRQRREPEELRFTLVGAVLLGAGVGYAAGLSPFVVCALAGAVIANLSPARRTARRLLRDWEPPVGGILLILAGALLAVPTPWVLLAVPVLAAIRLVARSASARAGQAVLHASGPPGLGLATAAQGAVALALGFDFLMTYPTSSALLTTVALGVLGAQTAAPWLIARASAPARLTPPPPLPEVRA